MNQFNSQKFDYNKLIINLIIIINNKLIDEKEQITCKNT